MRAMSKPVKSDPHNGSVSQRGAYMGSGLALALILGYVETLIPFDFAVPGVKLGLSNLVIVITLFAFGWKEALTIDILKVLLSGLLFGNSAMMLYSMTGALLSFSVMTLFWRIDRFSPMGISISGGVAHNLGQLMIAMVMMHTAGIVSYLPILVISGAVTGALLGTVAAAVLHRIRQGQNTF